MNLHHDPQPDARSDADTDAALSALLSEALAADPMPTGLQSRIEALTDPSFNGLLDEALAADPLPVGLESRILEAVLHTNAPALNTPTLNAPHERSVLARIGIGQRGWVGYAAAAVLALAAGGAFYFAGQGETPHNPVIADTLVQLGVELGALSDEVDALHSSEQTDTDALFVLTDISYDQTNNDDDGTFWGGSAGSFERELWNELASEDETGIELF